MPASSEIVVNLGVVEAKVKVGEHIAYFWETNKEFERGVDFLIQGLREGDHGVIFGYEEANDRVGECLRRGGYPVPRLLEEGRLTVLGAESTGDATLAVIGSAFQAALDRGAKLIRLLGNIGWGKTDWPDEQDILRFEARVTGAARQFPCVIFCMYDVQALPGTLILHGAFETHPVTVCGNVLRQNTHYVDLDTFLKQQKEREQ